MHRRGLVQAGLATGVLPWAGGCATPRWPSSTPTELRGTWLTTTANSAISTPSHTAATMRRLREIGLNTVYVECWKEGRTHYPSAVLRNTLGDDMLPARDLLEESLIEAHRQGLNHIAWFEYGFMAAFGASMTRLRQRKPEWLSRDAQGNELAPNGFVWMNPLHPDARRFLLDITLEAIQHYDLDGVQFDDRIVWPYVTMGYDAFTRQAYASEHGGRQPPEDAHEPGWMRWRADKLNALAQAFCAELRAALPGRVVSLSPAPYPWSFEHYLLEWPLWARWPAAQRWTEFVPQAYRFSYAAFERSWREQIAALQAAGEYRPQELMAGIRINGGGADSSWEQLRASIALARSLGNGGHVLWFSRGVLELHADALQALYAHSGPARSPHFSAGWRRPAVALSMPQADGALTRWTVPAMPTDRYRVIGHDGLRWRYGPSISVPGASTLRLPAAWKAAELIVDRRP
jgi:uncharacterized lipoprotein YddW (UPF0748 family)